MILKKHSYMRKGLKPLCNHYLVHNYEVPVLFNGGKDYSSEAVSLKKGS